MLGERNSIAWSSLPLPKRETDREGGGESDREDRKREVVVRKRMQCVLPGGGICTTEETGSDQVSTEVSEHEKVLNAAFFPGGEKCKLDLQYSCHSQVFPNMADTMHAFLVFAFLVFKTR